MRRTRERMITPRLWPGAYPIPSGLFLGVGDVAGGVWLDRLQRLTVATIVLVGLAYPLGFAPSFVGLGFLGVTGRLAPAGEPVFGAQELAELGPGRSLVVFVDGVLADRTATGVFSC